MGKYGEAAVRATGLVAREGHLSPVDAWHQAVSELFPDSEDSRKKSCPKSAFLGLCEMGVVRGVPDGSYTTSKRNKAYAVRALDALRSDPSLVERKPELWSIAVQGVTKRENEQMDVLLSLWREELLE